ncbi:hypothetical protein IGB42_01107 [Andreprevotia sp. IGB-42]|uniref:hemin uptake protein HemP n=1 Tax=Andreprevotia sp. IGB-42 TaxID=2497473 RepID=UPI00135B01C1|nr:hemin uptake protein HemP [Andreprevotia sp. IGB-42]KAF0814210.1 hypothetical protein IGB42_01107 [Andreprevotia sp. IGB-42]
MNTPRATPPSPAAQPLPAVIDSRSLLANQQVVVIEHKGVRYTLRETKQGKLILTK